MAAVGRGRSIVTWVISGLLAALFLVAGSGKIWGGEDMVKAFEHFGYPQWFRLFIGASEVAGGIGLLMPALAQWAAAGLMIIIAGAVWTHISTGEPFFMPLLVLVLLAVAIWLRRPSGAG